jgi:hypothetical protein
MEREREKRMALVRVEGVGEREQSRETWLCVGTAVTQQEAQVAEASEECAHKLASCNIKRP